MIDQIHLQGTDLRGQCTPFNITLLLYNADLHSFCQGNCMLPLWTMIWASSTSCNYNVWCDSVAAKGYQAIVWNGASVSYLFNKPDCYSLGKLWPLPSKKKMYLTETGFNLKSLDQPLEFFIYLNEGNYIHYVVKVPLYWTQRLRLPLDRILNEIKMKN